VSYSHPRKQSVEVIETLKSEAIRIKILIVLRVILLNRLLLLSLFSITRFRILVNVGGSWGFFAHVCCQFVVGERVGLVLICADGLVLICAGGLVLICAGGLVLICAGGLVLICTGGLLVLICADGTWVLYCLAVALAFETVSMFVYSC
jgi:hypothetical protein